MSKTIWMAGIVLALAILPASAAEGGRSSRPATPAEIEAIREAMTKRLVDVESARFTEVVVLTADPDDPTVCGLVNAKNKMGGYVGFYRFIGMVFPRPGQKPLAAIVAIDSSGTGAAETMCRARLSAG